MKKSKREAIEKTGWKVGSVADFLRLTPEESALLELKLARRIPMPESHAPTTIDTHSGPFLFQTHAAALAERMKAAVPPCAVVDARDAAAFARGRIPGAVRVDGRDLGVLPKDVEGAAEIFVVGTGPNDGNRRRLALALLQLGVRRVTELPGGMAEWEQLGLPIESGESAAKA